MVAIADLLMASPVMTDVSIMNPQKCSPLLTRMRPATRWLTICFVGFSFSASLSCKTVFAEPPAPPANVRICALDDPSCGNSQPLRSWAKRFGGTGADYGRSVAIDSERNIVIAGTFAGTADFGGELLSTSGSSDIFFAKYTNDGVLVWVKRIGSIGLEQSAGAAIDYSANCDGIGGKDCIVIGGTFMGTVDMDPGPGTTELTSTGSSDGFIAKFSSAGVFLWAKRFGGANSSFPDYLYGLAVDHSANCDGSGGNGCVLITGSFYESADFTGFQITGPNGFNSPFVAKYSGSGIRSWVKPFANTNEGFGRAVAVSSTGDVAITGTFKGKFNLGNGTRSSFGNDDVFVAKLNGSDGAGIWSTRHGSGGAEQGNAIIFDTADDVVLTGMFTSTSGGLTFGGESWSAIGRDIFIAKLSGADNGAHIWSRRCSGTYTMNRQGIALAADSTNNVLLTGHFTGSLDCGNDTQTITGSGGTDVLAAKFSATGTPLWMKGWGVVGTGNTGNSIVTDPISADVTVTGYFQGTLNMEGSTLTSAGSDDLFLMRLAP